MKSKTDEELRAAAKGVTGDKPAESTREAVAAKAGGRLGPGLELGEVYRRYAKELYKFARRWGFSPEDAEDFTQGFFLQLAEK